MDCGHGRIRMNIEGDRLSYLPDDLIHKILSCIDIKQAIETSALSSRWRYIWTSMPSLNLSSKDFHTFAKFSEFVTHVMSRRNNQAEVSFINLTFHGRVSQPFVKRILNTVLNNEFSQNVQQLNISCLAREVIESPLSLFRTQSLKHLTLIGCYYEHPSTTTPTWELPTLTTLNLHNVTFYVQEITNKHAGLFSNFANLKNLALKCCRMKGLSRFNISNPKLSNLTLEGGYQGGKLVTPQLKNLTLRNWKGKLLISAPDLASFHYEGYYYPLQLSDNLHLETVDICIFYYSSKEKENARNIVWLLQRLRSVKFLTLNLKIIKLLSSFVKLISHLPSPFTNLKSLKIYPDDATLGEQTHPNTTMSPEVKNYLLDGSPGATLTMVSHEEVRVVMNVGSARKLMSELEVLLDQWKQNCKTNTSYMKQGKEPMERHMTTVAGQVKVKNQQAQPDTKLASRVGKRMVHVNEKLKKGYKNTGRAISMLQEIEGLLSELPTSHRAKLQLRFSVLCAEAETVMDIMVDDLKTQCDKMPRLYFHELATTSQPSSS